jgi:hypothetical protein
MNFMKFMVSTTQVRTTSAAMASVSTKCEMEEKGVGEDIWLFLYLHLELFHGTKSNSCIFR